MFMCDIENEFSSVVDQIGSFRVEIPSIRVVERLRIFRAD